MAHIIGLVFIFLGLLFGFDFQDYRHPAIHVSLKRRQIAKDVAQSLEEMYG